MRAVFFLFTFLSTTVFALTPTELSSWLQHYSALKGDFQQERYLTGMSQPIVSTGKFHLKKDKALIWQMEKPFPSELEVSKDGISQNFGDNKIPAAGSPSMNQTQVKLLLALIGGDLKTLTEYFDLQANGTQEKWTLILLPKNAFLKQIFHRIEVEGGQFVNKVALQEAQGDVTILTFHDQSIKI